MGQTHQREAAIFDAALELPAEQRARHLDQACGGDAALRRRIESLLKACESKCEFLDSPTDPAAAKTMNVLPPSFEKPGDKIGRYKLLQQIGEGGCGVVYMAEQEEPVQRRVALKVIKLGLDTKSVIARFEAERQALALMDHPNIARVLDAGATETGRPYFVMELVRGLKITEYCDEARLSTNARLDLFIQVCQAIQHAHQKGIIHRDIKPSNILITINDGVPVPKVIDFGVAKATGGLKLTNKTVFTAFEQFIGTPAYMSPEQAVLTSLDIDTRSDIYALGVLLYELLTGKTPFDAKELLAIGLDEMRRTIREQEPPRPSTRLSTLPGQELSTTAQRRGLDAPKLVSELRGDLDWIVMKALEKDRARRYETANGLAMDIQRHLNNEPVVACPPSAAYRFQKLVRRNKLAFAAAAIILATLVLGTFVSAWQAVVATNARASAQAASKEAQLARISEAEEKQTAIVARDAARNQEMRARERLYVANVALANEALQKDHLGRARELLQKAAEAAAVDASLGSRQNSKQKDLRGWEWRYLWSQTRGDDLFILGRHEPMAQVALWMPDGVRAVSSGKDGLVKFWNVDQRRLINQLSFSNRVNGLAVSPDGNRVAIGETAGGFVMDAEGLERTRVSLWDTTNPQQLWQVKLPDFIGHLVYSPSGEMIAAAGGDRISVLWTKDGSSRYSLGGGRSPGSFKTGLAFSPDSKSLAFARGNECWILDLRTGTEEKLLEAQDALFTIAFSPDGHWLVCGDLAYAITIWDRQTRKIDRVIRSHHQHVACVAFSPDGTRLASAGADQTIKLWDTRTWEEICSLRGHDFEIWSVAFSPDGKRLISSAKDDTVRIWPTTRPARRLELPLPGSSRETVQALKRESDAAIAAVNTKTGGFILGDLFSGKITRQGTLHSLFLTNFSARTLVSERMAFGFPDGHVELWGLRSQQKIWSVTNRAIAATALASSTKAFQIAVAYEDGLIEMLKLETGEKGRSFQSGPFEIPIVAFSGNGRRLLAGSSSSTELSVWNLEDGQMNRLQLKQREGLISAAFSGDGEWVVTTSYDAFASLWQVDSGREIARFTGQFTGFRTAAISPDKTRIALTSNSSDEVSVWDPVTEQKLVSFPGGPVRNGFVSGWDPNSDDLVAVFGLKLYRWHAPSLVEIEATQHGQALQMPAWQCEPDQWLRWAAAQGDVAVLNNLAWLLATSSDSVMRNGRSAVDFAEKAVAKTERKNLGYLDTLAAAYAEAGEFAKAVNVQREAIALGRNENEKNDFATRLKLYESNTPYHEP